MNQYQIEPEERILEAKFGEAYLHYKNASETLVVMSDYLAFLAKIHIFVKKSLKHFWGL